MIDKFSTQGDVALSLVPRSPSPNTVYEVTKSCRLLYPNCSRWSQRRIYTNVIRNSKNICLRVKMIICFLKKEGDNVVFSSASLQKPNYL